MPPSEPRCRCPWCGTDPLYVKYHDEEWGLPVHDDAKHFEFLLLETQQAGLSWITILRKRENYRKAFAGFDPEKIARFTDADENRLCGDASIIRNRQKIRAALKNARAFLDVRDEFGSFDSYIWQFTDGNPVINRWRELSQLPASSPLSDALSKDMKKRGFSFVGSITLYAHLQAIGVINDHLVDCFRWSEVQGK